MRMAARIDRERHTGARRGILAYLHPDFRGIGVFPEYGRKFDQWHNVFWWYRPPNLENENSRTS